MQRVTTCHVRRYHRLCHGSGHVLAGLVSKVVVAADLEGAAHQMAESLRKNAPQAMATVKRMFWRLHGMSMEDGLVWASDMNAMARSTDECKEGITSFLDKRKPKWAE